MPSAKPLDLQRTEALLQATRAIELSSRRLVAGVLAGARPALFMGAGLDFAELREYAPGDDPRRIDHGVSARLRRPFVRRYVDEREMTLLFVLDRSGSMIGGSGGSDLLELAARVVGALGLAAVRHKDRVGLMLTGTEKPHWIRPQKSIGHLPRLIRECLASQPVGPSEGLKDALALLLRAQRRPASIVVLSDFHAPGWTAPLGQLALRHDVVACRLLPAKPAWPKAGLVRMVAPETGRTVVVDLARRETIAALAARERASEWSFRDAISAAGASALTIRAASRPGEDPIVVPLRRFVAARTAGRRPR